MSKKKAGRIVAIVLAAAVALSGAGYGVYHFTRGAKGNVKVFPVNMIASEGGWYDQNETEGMVRADNMQSVYISDTQKLTEVFVQEGQTVKAGEKLASFDTTLSDVELERQRIRVEKCRLELEDLNKELAKINRYKPYVAPTPTPTPDPTPVQPEELESWDVPTLIGGSGTAESPYRYLWDDSCMFTEQFINGLLPRLQPAPPVIPDDTDEPEEPEEPGTPVPPEIPGESAEDEETIQLFSANIIHNSAPDEESGGGQGEDEASVPVPGVPLTDDDEPEYEDNSVWVAFETREYNNPKGSIIDSFGIVFDRDESGKVVFRMFRPAVDYSDGDDTGYIDDGGSDFSGPSEEDGTFTATEINKMKAETRQRIKDKEIEIKVENVKYEKMKLELDTGIITANIDGVVKTVANEDESKQNHTPFIVVSAGGGYFVTGSVGELTKDELSIGDTVTVYSWMNGGMYDASVVEISEFPTDNSYYSGNGNPNVSYYPMTVEISDDAALQEGEYVSIQYSAGGNNGGGGMYLEAPFILSENARSYVYVEGEDGKLEKREIKTGKIMWGSSVEILGGVTMDDFIAFPYGKDVKDGANAVESDINELYEGMY